MGWKGLPGHHPLKEKINCDHLQGSEQGPCTHSSLFCSNIPLSVRGRQANGGEGGKKWGCGFQFSRSALKPWNNANGWLVRTAPNLVAFPPLPTTHKEEGISWFAKRKKIQKEMGASDGVVLSLQQRKSLLKTATFVGLRVGEEEEEVLKLLLPKIREVTKVGSLQAKSVKRR